MARFYSNENFPFPVVNALRSLGHDVLTVLETGKSEQAWPDEAVLAYAAQSERAVLTLNRKHFILLHKKNQGHWGIIVCTVDLNFERQARAVDAEVRKVGDLRGQLLRVNRPPTAS